MSDGPIVVGEQALAAVGAGEPAWLSEVRAHAFEQHLALPLPDRALHRWRYVDPARLVAGDLPLRRLAALRRGPDLPAGAPSALEIRRDPGGAQACFSAEALTAEIEVLDLATAAADRRELVEPWLGQLVAAADSPFAALNAAFWSGGLFLRVPPGARLTRPIHLRTSVPEDGLVLPRNLLVLGEGAEITILEELTGAGEGRLMVHRTSEVVVGAGARLDLVEIQEFSPRTTSASVTHVRVDRDAVVRELFAGFGAGLAKADLVLSLDGRGADAEILGAVFGGGRQQFDCHTVLEHRAPDTTSRLDVRVALRGKARSSATGRLEIGKQAVRSQAYQENRNLLLSETANAVSIPELEILTDEVQAKHGATVGPIDEDQLYYLNSRGLPPAEATAMIVGGFFEALLAQVPEGLVKDLVRARVDARLATP